MRRWIEATGLVLMFAAGVWAQTTSAPTTAPSSQPTTQPVSALGPGTRVTLSLKETPAKAAFDELAKVSKIKLAPTPPNIFDGNAAPPITLEAVDMPWLEAATQMSLQASLRVQQMGDNVALMQGVDRRMNGPRASVGPLLFVLTNLSVDTELQYGESNRTFRTASFNGTMLAEPSLAAASLVGSLRVSGTDDKGRAVQQKGSQGVAAPGAGYFNRRDFNFTVQLPDVDTTQIATLDVAFLLEQIDEAAELKIDDLLKEGSTGSVRGATFTVQEVKSQALQQYLVTLDVKATSMPKEWLPQLQRMQPPFQPRVVEDARAGQAVSISSFRPAGNGGKMTLLVRQTVVKEGKDAKKDKDALPKMTLTWRVPISYRRVEAPVQFKGIPIPQ